ncbi:hypothetical protein K439DRAFT_1612009 [Ramaria rubella]|nr:hypothetical protein K439DRAFT_1612009 [Ramaria rubella]
MNPKALLKLECDASGLSWDRTTTGTLANSTLANPHPHCRTHRPSTRTCIHTGTFPLTPLKTTPSARQHPGPSAHRLQLQIQPQQPSQPSNRNTVPMSPKHQTPNRPAAYAPPPPNAPQDPKSKIDSKRPAAPQLQ